MNNLVFWAHSYCRSTLKFYSELAKALSRNCFIYIWIENLDLRSATGFSNSEFSDLKIVHIGDDIALAEKTLANHIDDYGIFSEAPCNMDKYTKRLFKALYLRCFLPVKLKKIIVNTDFILNASGYYKRELLNLGWKPAQIISCGYYPPRIPGSKLMERTENNWRDFTILLSGLHQWHRSPWILLRALDMLKKKGIVPKCYITQSGPYLGKMKDYAKKHQLSNVEFLGFVDISKLIHLYETCSVYVGCGNYEPWGMRLNDCLLCGAPLIVNRGMGGVKMVDEYDCGLSFNRGDYFGLANAIERLMTDETLYLQIAKNAINAAEEIKPEKAAEKYANQIKKFIQ